MMTIIFVLQILILLGAGLCLWLSLRVADQAEEILDRAREYAADAEAHYRRAAQLYKP